MTILDFKSHFYFSPEQANFNNAGQSAIPDVNVKTAQHWLERFYKEGASCAMAGWAETEVVREKIARFLGAETDEVAYFQTTASAISQAAFGIPLTAGDEILTWDQEYPSNFYPWNAAAKAKGAKIISITSENWETPAEKLVAAITDRTKVIAVSWVQYHTGSVTDLKKIADKVKGKDIWLVADIIQGAGVRPFSFRDSGFDIVCGGSHKWLCSSYGAGYMIIKKSRQAEMQPLEFGAMTYGDPDTQKKTENLPKATSHKFEPGSKAMIEVIAMGSTLDLFLETKIENIFAEASRLGEKLRSGIKDLGFLVLDQSGPFVSVYSKNPEELKELEHKLKLARIAFGPHRGPGIRLSTHACNRDAEIEYLLNTLR